MVSGSSALGAGSFGVPRSLKRRSPSSGGSGSGSVAGFVGAEAAEEQVAFDLGLVGFVGQELRDPGLADAEAAEELARGLRAFAIEPAGPGGGEIVFDEHRILGLRGRPAGIGRMFPPTSRRGAR